MSLREKILLRMELRQRIMFAVIFGLSVIVSIIGELLLYPFYRLEIFHIVIIAGTIQLIFNPQGLRLLFFLLFSYLLMNLFSLRYDTSFSFYDSGELMFGFPLHFAGASSQTNIYFHIGLYSSMAFLSFRSPFRKEKNKKEGRSDVIDRFE